MCRRSQRAPRRRCVREGVSCDMPPSSAADQSGRRGAVKPIDEFERQQEPRALGPVRRAAPGDLDDGDGVVRCIVIDTPPFAPDSNEVATVQRRRMRRGHGPWGCTTRSVAGGAVLGRRQATVTEAQSYEENPGKFFSVSLCLRGPLWRYVLTDLCRWRGECAELPASAEARASICA
jgi:hypothetical protein